jgi:PIN domain nuclease of toxin-antitoxin system
LAALHDPANEVWFSVVNIWEMVIKAGLGKLTPRVALGQIAAEQQANGLRLLGVTLEHVIAVEELPPIHKDPFDRLLLAQARTEGMQLVSSDRNLPGYGTPIVW